MGGLRARITGARDIGCSFQGTHAPRNQATLSTQSVRGARSAAFCPDRPPERQDEHEFGLVARCSGERARQLRERQWLGPAMWPNSTVSSRAPGHDQPDLPVCAATHEGATSGSPSRQRSTGAQRCSVRLAGDDRHAAAPRCAARDVDGFGSASASRESDRDDSASGIAPPSAGSKPPVPQSTDVQSDPGSHAGERLRVGGGSVNSRSWNER